MAGRLGMPGRGAAVGIPGVRWVSLAARSGRGGTTGRAEGCPARLGFAGGRRGPPPPIGGVTPALEPGAFKDAFGADGMDARGAEGSGAEGPLGRGTIFGVSTKPGGSG